MFIENVRFVPECAGCAKIYLSPLVAQCIY